MSRALPKAPATPPFNSDEPISPQLDGLILIGKLAEITSIAPSAIRFYEKEGLLEPRKLGRLRTYSEKEAETLRMIVRLRKTGLPITRIREALLLSKQVDAVVRKDAMVKIIEKQIEDLAKMHEVVGEQISNAMSFLRELDS
jgi:DNA-binding transcriptional MerR regulator